MNKLEKAFINWEDTPEKNKKLDKIFKWLAEPLINNNKQNGEIK